MVRRSASNAPARETSSTAAGFGVVGAILLSTLLVVGIGSRPTDPTVVAAVFPPWWSQGAAFAAASAAGDVTGVGGVSFVVIVRAPDGEAEARLRRSGALFTLIPPEGLGCGPQDA